MKKNIIRVITVALAGVFGFGADAMASAPPSDSTPVATDATATPTTQPSMEIVLEGPGGQAVTVSSYCDLVNLAMKIFGDSMRCDRSDPNLPIFESMYQQIMTNDSQALLKFSEVFDRREYSNWPLDIVVVPDDMTWGIFACAARSDFSFEFFRDNRINQIRYDGIEFVWQKSAEILCPWLLNQADPSFTITMASFWGEDFTVTCGDLSLFTDPLYVGGCGPELQAYFNSFPEVNPYGFDFFASDEVAGDLVVYSYQGRELGLDQEIYAMADLGLNACFAERVKGTGVVGFQEYLDSRALYFENEGETQIFFDRALEVLCPN